MPSPDVRDRRVAAPKSTNSDYLRLLKDRKPEKEPLITRPIRRRSESSDYRIRAQRKESSNENSLHELQTRLADLKSSYSKTRPSSITANEPIPLARSSSGLPRYSFHSNHPRRSRSCLQQEFLYFQGPHHGRTPLDLAMAHIVCRFRVNH